DHVSDINLVYTEHARRYLLAEGLRPETVIKTGSPMKQVLAAQKRTIESSRALEELGLERGRYFVVSAHREENVDDPRRFAAFLQTLSGLREKYQQPIIVSTHPRTRKRLESGAQPIPQDVRFMKPLSFADYVHLQTHARCTLSDSGTL